MDGKRGSRKGIEKGEGKGEENLVAADFLGNVIQGLDDAQTEFLALLVFGDGDVFDVAYFAEVVNAARTKWGWISSNRLVCPLLSPPSFLFFFLLFLFCILELSGTNALPGKEAKTKTMRTELTTSALRLMFHTRRSSPSRPRPRRCSRCRLASP